MNPPKTAPKDGTMIIGDFGEANLLPAVYNPVCDNWSVVSVACEMSNGVWNDYYFERDVMGNLLGWLPWPEVK